MSRVPKPEWLRVKAHSISGLETVENMLKELHLNTVCDEILLTVGSVLEEKLQHL